MKSTTISFRVPVATRRKLDAKAKEAGVMLSMMMQSVADAMTGTAAERLKQATNDFDKLVASCAKYDRAIKKAREVLSEQTAVFDAMREDYINSNVAATVGKLAREAVHTS